MNKDDMLRKLQAVRNTLDSLRDIRGFDNWKKILGCDEVLAQIQQAMQEQEKPEEEETT